MRKILIVDDEEKLREILQFFLKRAGFETAQAADGEEALELIKKYNYSMVITDLKMPKMDGMTLLKEIKKVDPDCPVLILTAYGNPETGFQAGREGALGYITKPFEEKEVVDKVRTYMRVSEVVEENRIYREELAKLYDFSNIIGVSQPMMYIIAGAGEVAKSPYTTVLITGESGTGKELLAKVIHHNSSRKGKRFTAINCAAIPSTLIESELFGHEKGAFTGADKQKIGKLELTNEGTVFLDEIGDLSIESQPKVLRFLQEREFERVGGTGTLKSDVRVICATNKDLKEQVEKGTFREDLYFRINVFPLNLPPLKERDNDLILLAEYFVKEFCEAMGKFNPGIDPAAEKILQNYSWPGNVRELKNTIERAVILSRNGTITPETLRFLSGTTAMRLGGETPFPLPEDGIKLEEIERQIVRQALHMANENQTVAAKLLGLTRGKFRSLLKQLKELDQ
jgi:DNA-binding NtrC family response regulator